jgi:hypothetical protein
MNVWSIQLKGCSGDKKACSGVLRWRRRQKETLQCCKRCVRHAHGGARNAAYLDQEDGCRERGRAPQNGSLRLIHWDVFLDEV